MICQSGERDYGVWKDCEKDALYECPHCAFKVCQFHRDIHDGHSCPECEPMQYELLGDSKDDPRRGRKTYMRCNECGHEIQGLSKIIADEGHAFNFCSYGCIEIWGNNRKQITSEIGKHKQGE